MNTLDKNAKFAIKMQIQSQLTAHFLLQHVVKDSVQSIFKSKKPYSSKFVWIVKHFQCQLCDNTFTSS